MIDRLHYKKLEHLYLTAPVSALYPGLTIEVSEGRSVISLPVNTTFFHGGGGLHGSVYFKLLDDAAWFAAASLNADHFLLTVDFTIQFHLPMQEGRITAAGTCAQRAGKLLAASASLTDQTQRVLASGTGHFIKSATPLSELQGYAGSD